MVPGDGDLFLSLLICPLSQVWLKGQFHDSCISRKELDACQKGLSLFLLWNKSFADTRLYPEPRPLPGVGPHHAASRAQMPWAVLWVDRSGPGT